MYTLLMLDLDQKLGQAIKSSFDPEFYNFHSVSSIEEATLFLKGVLPDVILLVLDATVKYEMDFCQALKKDGASHLIPILLLLDFTDTERILKLVNIGIEDYLPKNSDQRLIVAKIRSLLKIKSLQEEASILRRLEGFKKIIATYNHEFNNPLTIAIGNLTWLKKNVSATETLTRIDRLGNALDRMVELIKKIREFRDQIEARDRGNVNTGSSEPQKFANDEKKPA